MIIKGKRNTDDQIPEAEKKKERKKERRKKEGRKDNWNRKRG